MKLPLTGDRDADELLGEDGFALLTGMLLDQQVPMEKAFRGPYDLKERLGGRLDPAEIAGLDPDTLVELFVRRPALHRFPAAMAARTQALAAIVSERYGGDASRLWDGAGTGQELFERLRELPGFGEQKARIFLALLAKRLDVCPTGWEELAGPYGRAGYFSVADIDGPDALARVREHKKAVKAEARAKAAPAGAEGRRGARPSR